MPITDDQKVRYYRAGHRVQSAVKFMLENDQQMGTPKDLRTGLDLRASDMKGLAYLLIAKGVFTEDEYIEAVIKAAVEEGDRYEAEAEKLTGVKITFA
jgi:hypothetical protein